MSDLKRILFVDDEPSVLQGLRRMLHKMRSQWTMEFAESGQVALDTLAEKEFDIIVTDMRMPGMNGAQLLEKVRERHPDMIRLVLSGHSDKELILRSVGPAHQFLAKPCDADTLVSTVKRSCALREFLSSHVLTKIVSQIESLPVLPTVYSELVQSLSDESASLDDVGAIIAKDIGMTAKILQLVNSAFFGLNHKIDDPTRAIFYLGLDTVKGLVLSTGVFTTFNASQMDEFSVDAVQDHCLRVGMISRMIAQEQGESATAQNDAFMAGVLHDVGKLIMVANFPKECREIRQHSEMKNIPPVEAEAEIIGATHAQLGGYLLGLWGLPDPIVEAVTLHPYPRHSPNREFGPLTAVSTANRLDQEINRLPEDTRESVFDTVYLAELDLTDQLPVWREQARDLLHETTEPLVGAADAN